MVIQVRGRVLNSIPETLDEFFDLNPEIGVANMLLTEMEHTSMWRDEVLFIHQRQQATSDYRENTRVRWIGEINGQRPFVMAKRAKMHFDRFARCAHVSHLSDASR